MAVRLEERDLAATDLRQNLDAAREEGSRLRSRVAELERQPVLGKSLVKRATLFVKHVGEYRQQRRADPAAILKELLAP